MLTAKTRYQFEFYAFNLFENQMELIDIGRCTIGKAYIFNAAGNHLYSEVASASCYRSDSVEKSIFEQACYA